MGKAKPPEKPPEPPKRGRGNVPQITAARVQLLVKAIGNGTPRMQAARLAKISYTTYRNWINWGEEAWNKAGECEAKVKPKDKLYVDLFLGVGEAIAKTVDEALSNIRKAGKKNWQADAWLVARLCPGQYGDNRKEISELKKALADLVKEMAEYQNTKLPDMPTPPPEVPPELIPLPESSTPKPEIPLVPVLPEEEPKGE